MLAAQRLTKRYGRLTALSDVSFSVHAGEVLGLIGPNGSGKTTLFECLGGVLPLDGGSLVRNGRPMSERERASTLFYLPDAIVPWPSQTVRWAIDFTLGFFGGRTDLTSEVIQRLEIGALLDSTIGSLSKGQRKRALLAIGLLMPHPVLMADEPFDGLDLRQSREVGETLRVVRLGGTHDVPVDPPDPRRRPGVRSVRAPERRPHARRGHDAGTGRARGGAHRIGRFQRRSRRGVPCAYLGRRSGGWWRRRSGS